MSEESALIPAIKPDLVSLALMKGAGIDVVERIAALVERREAIEAKKDHTAAIIKFKGLCPPIIKKNPVRGKKNQDGSQGPIHYHFAGYDDIKAVTIPFERECGISTAFTFDVTTASNLMGRLKVTVGSHTEEYTFGVPIPKGINTSNTQDFGAACTYLKRYLYCAAFDIVVTGEDSDAAGLIEHLSPDQYAVLNSLTDQLEAKKVKHDGKWWRGIFGADSLEDLEPKDYEVYLRMLTAKLGATK